MGFQKGHIAWNKGLTKETDERLKKIGKKVSKSRKGIEPWNKGLTKETDERIKKMGENTSKGRLKRKQELGYLISPEARRKQGKAISGVNNPNWNPNRGEVYAPYGENFYNQNIRNRKWDLQNSRDMLTGTILNPDKKNDYHHIDYCKSNDDPDNHCFVSSNNHMRITANQSKPIKSERYQKILQENTLALKNGQIPKYWSQINKELFRQEKLKQLNLSLYI